MSTTVLLIILGVCVVAVLAAAGYAIRSGVRLGRTAARTADKFSAASAQLSEQAAQIQARMTELGARQAEIATTVESLRTTTARLQLVIDTARRAAGPVMRIAALKASMKTPVMRLRLLVYATRKGGTS